MSSLSVLNEIREEIRGVKQEDEKSVVARVEKAHAAVLAATSVPEWGRSPRAIATVNAAKAEIAAALAELPGSQRERAEGIGKIRARISLANELKKALATAGAGKVQELDAVYVALVADAIEGRNLFALPYKDEQSGDEVTFDGLKNAPVEDGKFNRGSEVIFGRGQFRAKGEDGRMHAVIFHAPSFQKSKMVQAFVLAMRSASHKLADLAKKAWEAKQTKQANQAEGAWKGAPRPNKMQRVMTGELEARGLQEYVAGPAAAGGLSDEDEDKLAELQAKLAAAEKPGRRTRQRR